IRSCHVVLAGIAEQQKVWGPPDNPRSMLFQLNKLLEAEQRVRQWDPNYPPTIWAYENIGRAPPEPHEAPEDRQGYRPAVVSYLQAGLGKDALRVVGAARGGNLDWDGNQRGELRRFTVLATNQDKVRMLGSWPQEKTVRAVAFAPDGKHLLW